MPDQRTHLLSEHGSILNVVELPDDRHVENQLGDDGAIRTLELVHQIGSDPHFLNDTRTFSMIKDNRNIIGFNSPGK